MITSPMTFWMPARNGAAQRIAPTTAAAITSCPKVSRLPRAPPGSDTGSAASAAAGFRHADRPCTGLSVDLLLALRRLRGDGRRLFHHGEERRGVTR